MRLRGSEAAIALAVVLECATLAILSPHFFTTENLLNVSLQASITAIVAVGMTFVILAGGIDLSVGAMVALSTVLSATMLEHWHWPAYVTIPAVLAVGSTLGMIMGAIIHFFEIQPFIVTLAGLFFARGLCYVITTEAIPIRDPFWVWMGQTPVNLGQYHVSPSEIVALAVVLIAAYVLSYTRLGRNTYAIGGNEQSALLMGLPVARTKITVYTVSGFCSALGGLLFSFYLPSGDSLHGIGMELDAIAAVVIGGTLLTGGAGYLFGTVIGVLVLGLIQTIIRFDGTLSSWWTRMVIAILLFVFIVLQRVVVWLRR